MNNPSEKKKSEVYNRLRSYFVESDEYDAWDFVPLVGDAIYEEFRVKFEDDFIRVSKGSTLEIEHPKFGLFRLFFDYSMGDFKHFEEREDLNIDVKYWAIDYRKQEEYFYDSLEEAFQAGVDFIDQ